MSLSTLPLTAPCASRIDYPDDKLTLSMDLEARHCHSWLIDLTGLLAARMRDFSPDIYGIRQHINRDTGKLEHCFVPRYALSNARGNHDKDQNCAPRSGQAYERG